MEANFKSYWFVRYDSICLDNQQITWHIMRREDAKSARTSQALRDKWMEPGEGSEMVPLPLGIDGYVLSDTVSSSWNRQVML